MLCLQNMSKDDGVINIYQHNNILLKWILPGIIMCMRPASERRRYIVTSSLIGWAYTKKWSMSSSYHLYLLTHWCRDKMAAIPQAVF